MTKFTWTQTDRAKLVPGATVVVHWECEPPTRREVKALVGLYVAMEDHNGDVVDAYMRIEACDPTTIRPPRQLEMFAQEKP